MSDKEAVIQRVQQLPETASVGEIVEELEILAAVRRGEKAADEGRTKPHEEVKRLLAEWTAR